MTLKEIIEQRRTPLLNPNILIYDKEHLEQGIINHFLFREIAFPTPDKFIWKLNAYVSERAQSYNKMFTSQLIEIDPFVTDYIVQSNSGNQKISEHKRDKKSEYNQRDSVYTSDTSSDSIENYTDSDENKHYKENSGVETKAKLNSESENKNNREDKKTTLAHNETTTENIDTTEKADFSENVNTSENNGTTENTDYSENVNTSTSITEDVDKTGNKDYTHNQTGRNWTENGNSSGHNLDVHSDTPQAMLFNTPPHYTGTGRMGLEGQTNSPSSEYPNHYTESDPNSIDSASLNFNGGDSPWFNYASSADNKIGHDSYSKSGTETFSQTDATKETETEGTEREEEGSKTTKGNKSVKGTETKQGTKDTTNNKNTVGTKDTEGTKNYTENGTQEVNGSDSRSFNANEHTKGDTKNQENYKEESASKYDKTANNIGKRADNTFTKAGTASDRKQKNEQETLTNNESVRKGRTMRSPSQLLAEYRETMTFNADLWLYGELEPLFMQLY